MPYFLIHLTPCRHTLPLDATSEEREIINAHFEHLKSNMEQGILWFAGRTEGAELGLAVINCESEQEAQEILDEDPCIVNKVMTGKLYPFMIALREDKN